MTESLCLPLDKSQLVLCVGTDIILHFGCAQRLARYGPLFIPLYAFGLIVCECIYRMDEENRPLNLSTRVVIYRREVITTGT